MCVRRLKELLRAKLVECGWKDQLKALCKGIVFRRLCWSVLPWNCICEVIQSPVCPDVIKEKGLEHVTVEDLVTEVTPKGRGTDLDVLFIKSNRLGEQFILLFFLLTCALQMAPCVFASDMYPKRKEIFSYQKFSSVFLLVGLSAQHSYQTAWRKNSCRESELF